MASAPVSGAVLRGMVLAGTLVAGCVGPAPSGTHHRPVGDVDVALEAPPASSRSHLVRVVRVHADRTVTTRLTLDDGVVAPRVVVPPYAGDDLLFGVPGFRTDRATDVSVEVLDAADGSVLQTATFHVEAEPIDDVLPEFSLKVASPGADRGDTLFPARNDALGGYVLLVDERGELIFAFDGQGSWWRSARLLDDGRLLLIGDHDLTLTDWADLEPMNYAPPPGFEGYHHEALPRPGGGAFTLTAAPLEVPDLPRSLDAACEPGAPGVIWDSLVVEVDADGAVVNSWSLGERLDTHRLGWDSLSATPLGPDWGHANGLDYVASDDSFVVSMRNQELILKMSRATGEVQWILSNPDGWSPEFDALRLRPTEANHRWNFHQHAPEWHDGALLFHDNGAVGNMPCGTTPQQPIGTRVVELLIDEQTGEFTEQWSWTNHLFSPIMGDADRLGNGHVLATFGSLDGDEHGVSYGSRQHGDKGARFVEFDPSTGDVVWDLDLFEADRGDNPGGFQVPRSRRIGSWWPAEAP